LGIGPVLVLNGDSFCEYDLPAFLAWHLGKPALASLLLSYVSDCSRYGSVTLGADDSVATFEEKGSATGAGWINAGVYLLDSGTIAAIPEGTLASLERDVFPSLIGRGLFGLRLADGAFIDIGTPESYARASEFFASLDPLPEAGGVGKAEERGRGGRTRG
jgi:NDP-sugar pyrophosphorylase family protein